MPVAWEDFEAVDQPKTEAVDWNEFEPAPQEVPDVLKGVPRNALELAAKNFGIRQQAKYLPPEGVGRGEVGALEPFVPIPRVESTDPRFKKAVKMVMDPFGDTEPSQSDLEGIAAVLNTGKGVLETAQSPLGIATAGVGALGGIAAKLATLGWGLFGASQIPKSIEAYKQAKTGQEKLEAGLGGALNVALPLGAATHIYPPFVKATLPEVLARQIGKAPLEIPEALKPLTPITPEVAPWAQLTKPPPSVKRAVEPEVPATPPEPERGVTVLEEIRSKNARTKEQIKALYPQLNREEAGELRDRAWGKPPEPPAEPPAAPPAEPVPKEPTPPTKGPATTEEILGPKPLVPEPPTEPGKTISEQEQTPTAVPIGDQPRFKLKTLGKQGVVEGEGGQFTLIGPVKEEPNGTFTVDRLMALVPPDLLSKDIAPRVEINLAEKMTGKTPMEARLKAYQALTDEINKGNFDIFKQPKEEPKQLPPPPPAEVEKAKGGEKELSIPSIKSNPIGQVGGIPLYEGAKSKSELAKTYGIPTAVTKDVSGYPFGKQSLAFIDESTGTVAAFWHEPSPTTLTPAESTRLKSLTDKLESGKPLTSAEQKRYRALKDKVSPPEGEKPGVEVLPAKSGEVPSVDVKQGDVIRWEPNENERRYQSPVEGIVQDVIHNTEGEIGFHIFSPKEGDPSNVVRVWANRGKVVSRKPSTVEQEPVSRERPEVFRESGTVPRPKTVTEIADEIAARGIDPQASYGQFVKARDLKPEISAKEWLPIYRQSLKLAKLNKAIEVTKKSAPPTTPPSTGEGMVGPGSPSATQPPDPTTFGVKTGNPILNHIEAKAKKVYRGIGQLFQRRDVRTALPQSANGVETLANTYGDQTKRGLQLHIPDKADREATSMLMQSLKQPDSQNWLRTRAQDMETAAQAFVQRGTAEDRIQAKTALDMAKAYRHAADNFDRLRPKAEEAKRRFDSVYTRDTNSGINVDYEQWYVPQRWDLDLIKSGDGPIVLGGSGKGAGGQSFRKAKVFNDFGEAIEYALSTPGEYFIPRTLDIAELLGHRARTSERLIQRKRFFEELKDVSDPVNGKPIATDIPRRRIERPDGTVDYQESVPRDYERFEILPGNPIAIHKGYSRLIKALMGHSDLTESSTVRTIQDIAAVEKHLALVLDTFHASRMLQGGAALGHKVYLGKTLTQALALVEYSPPDLAMAVRNGDITQGMADYVNTPVEWQINGRPVMETRHNIVKMLGKNGLNYGRVADAVYRDWIRNLPGIGAVNKWVFDKISRGVTADIGQMEFDRISRARPDLDATQVSRMVARDVNAFFGNLQKESIFKGRTTNAIMQVGFLAHQWVEALAKRELLAARQFAQIPVDIAKGRPVSIGTAARGVGTGIAAYMVGTQLLNLWTRGHLTFSNPEEGHKLDAWIPDFTGKTGGFFISPLSVFGEITHDVLRYSRTKPTVHEAVLQVAHNKLGPIGRAAYVAGTGRDPVSDARLPSTAARALTAAWQVTPRPIIAGTAGQLLASKVAPGKVSEPPPGAMQRQLTASMGFKTEPAGTAAGQLHNLAREWMDKNTDPKVKERLIQLQSHDTPSIFQDLRSALRNGDTALAKAEFSRLVRTHDVKDIARSIQVQHPFTGSIATDRRFLASLNDYQKGLYRQAIKDRAELAKRFVAMARDYYKERNKNASSK